LLADGETVLHDAVPGAVMLPAGRADRWRRPGPDSRYSVAAPCRSRATVPPWRSP